MDSNSSNDMANNFRSAVLTESSLMPPSGSNFGTVTSAGDGLSDPILRTPFAGNVRALPPPPPLPQSPYGSQLTSGYGGGYGSSFGGGYSGFGGGYGSYGGYGGFGSGLGGFGSYGGGFGGYGGYGGGAYNRFGGMNPMDPEARFIQIAEASSRPAFQSIESLVSAIGNIAAMLDSTFFALTSSFRAILGVAANFGRLRGVFAQFWQTFAIFRGLTWIYRKILYWLRLSNLDPSSENFKAAFAEAVNETSAQSGAPKLPRKGQSPWPVLAFLSFIFTAPYLIMKLLGTVTNTAQEEARNPAKWVQPIATIALYDFEARNPGELSTRANQHVLVAPKEIQNTLGLLNTGWAMASTLDRQNAGIIPINYVKSPQQLRDEQQQQRAANENLLNKEQLLPSDDALMAASEKSKAQKPDLEHLLTSNFPAPPDFNIPDSEIASQPLGAPTTTIDQATTAKTF